MSGIVTKQHSNAQKYRCLPTLVFWGEAWQRKQSLLDDLFPSQAQSITGARPVRELEGEDAEAAAITANIEWIFTPGRPIEPGRFNPKDFAAYYTAKEKHTAIQERRAKSNSKGRLVVFTVNYTGVTRELRSLNPPFPIHNASDCLNASLKCREAGHDAVAAHSVQVEGGNCCAIFKATAIKPGGVDSYVDAV
ncbi:MAG: RES family NAD+ phosphorylase [Terricaulis sp.]